MSVWLAIALGFSGFTALWRSMAHPAHVPPGRPPLAERQRALARIAGWVLITVSFVLCAQARGAAIGAVLWLGTLTVSALLLVLGLLPYRPRLIAPLAWSAPLVAGALWLLLG